MQQTTVLDLSGVPREVGLTKIIDDERIELHRGSRPTQFQCTLQFKQVTFKRDIAAKFQAAAVRVQGIDRGVSDPKTSRLDKTFFEDQVSSASDPNVESGRRECRVRKNPEGGEIALRCPNRSIGEHKTRGGHLQDGGGFILVHPNPQPFGIDFEIGVKLERAAENVYLLGIGHGTHDASGGPRVVDKAKDRGFTGRWHR